MVFLLFAYTNNKKISRGVHWTPALMKLYVNLHNFWYDENYVLFVAANRVRQSIRVYTRIE